MNPFRFEGNVREMFEEDKGILPLWVLEKYYPLSRDWESPNSSSEEDSKILLP